MLQKPEICKHSVALATFKKYTVCPSQWQVYTQEFCFVVWVSKVYFLYRRAPENHKVAFCSAAILSSQLPVHEVDAVCVVGGHVGTDQFAEILGPLDLSCNLEKKRKLLNALVTSNYQTYLLAKIPFALLRCL